MIGQEWPIEACVVDNDKLIVEIIGNLVLMRFEGCEFDRLFVVGSVYRLCPAPEQSTPPPFLEYLAPS